MQGGKLKKLLFFMVSDVIVLANFLVCCGLGSSGWPLFYGALSVVLVCGDTTLYILRLKGINRL